MVDWYVDPGLARFINQWKASHPGAVVYTIADEHHSSVSDHAPEADGSVDAADVMPGAVVSTAELDELAETLRLNRDPRIKYVIRRDRIFSGPAGPLPWDWRVYGGDYHHHLHLSVGDAHEGKPVTDWDLTAPEGEDDMPSVSEIVNGVWSAQSSEYYDADEDGTRQKRTRVDVLHRAEAAAQKAEELAGQAVEDTALIRAELEAQAATLQEILSRLPAPPES